MLLLLLLLSTSLPFAVFQSVHDPLLGFQALPRGDVAARQEVVVQSPALVDRAQGRRRQVEAHHLVEDLRIDPLDKDVGFEGPLGVFHREREVVSGPDVLSVVEAPAGSVRAKPALLVFVARFVVAAVAVVATVVAVE